MSEDYLTDTQLNALWVEAEAAQWFLSYEWNPPGRAWWLHNGKGERLPPKHIMFASALAGGLTAKAAGIKAGLGTTTSSSARIGQKLAGREKIKDLVNLARATAVKQLPTTTEGMSPEERRTLLENIARTGGPQVAVSAIQLLEKIDEARREEARRVQELSLEGNFLLATEKAGSLGAAFVSQLYFGVHNTLPFNLPSFIKWAPDVATDFPEIWSKWEDALPQHVELLNTLAVASEGTA